MRMRKEFDVVVVGGGTAGAIAAIAAARTGARTLVIEQYGTIGGVLTLGQSVLGAADNEGYLALGGIGGELFERLAANDGGTRTSIDSLLGSITGQDPEALKLTLLDMAAESGVNFLLHSFVVDVLKDGERICAVTVANKAGLEIIPGRTFVDCSGDADLVARAGGQFTKGRPLDAATQPVSAIFRLGSVDVGATLDYLEANPHDICDAEGFSGSKHTIEHLRSTPAAQIVGFNTLISQARAAGEWDVPVEWLTVYTLPGRSEVGINATRVHGIDGTDPDDLTRAEIETQRQVAQVTRFLRKYVPGFERARLLASSYQVGIRETRHIEGGYTLTADDVLAGSDFEDQIGRGAYPLDIHDVKPGTLVMNRSVEGTGITYYSLPRSYGIPARCLMPVGFDNLLVAGRSISATHEAAGSIRGQAVCMVTGHAAGTLAALSSRLDKAPTDIGTSALQSTLREQGAIIERVSEHRIEARTAVSSSGPA
ncbi:FAD-dependent oxidoreductase [Bosea sp. (in: a-proteobacteria)]|jgi:hypothetical protein|uniref:FAD-dependent oxidoreductase n=1 Tax=Bosea sp. (in: a-proteobacteria) TaxID=1871050 RepID=UPI003F6FE7B1